MSTQLGAFTPDDLDSSPESSGLTRDQIREYALSEAARRGLDPKFVDRLFKLESGYNPRAVSKKGAQGVGQLMPDTAKAYGVTNPFDAKQNVDGALAYLQDLQKRFNGDPRLIASGYHAGEGLAAKALANPKRYPATVASVQAVVGGPQGKFSTADLSNEPVAGRFTPDDLEAPQATSSIPTPVQTPTRSSAAKSALPLDVSAVIQEALMAGPQATGQAPTFQTPPTLPGQFTTPPMIPGRGQAAPQAPLPAPTPFHVSTKDAQTQAAQTIDQMLAGPGPREIPATPEIPQAEVLSGQVPNNMAQIPPPPAPVVSVGRRRRAVPAAKVAAAPPPPNPQVDQIAAQFEAIKAGGQLAQLNDEQRNAFLAPLVRAGWEVGKDYIKPPVAAPGQYPLWERQLAQQGVTPPTSAPTSSLGPLAAMAGPFAANAPLGRAVGGALDVAKGMAAMAPPIAEIALDALAPNPYRKVEAAKTLYQMLGEPQAAEYQKAQALTKERGYKDGRAALADPEIAAHFAAAMWPFIGPMAAHAGERMGSGDIAGGLGEAAAILTPMILHGVKGGAEKGKGATETKAAATEAVPVAPEPTPVPEAKPALDAQMDALINERGSRKAVMVTPGETPPETPKGYVATQVTVPGQAEPTTFIHDPNVVSAKDVKASVADGTFHELLGIKEPRDLNVQQAAVVARDAKGQELQAALASEDAVEGQVKEFKAQYPDATITVEHPGKVVLERIANQEEGGQANARQGTQIQPEAGQAGETHRGVGGEAGRAAEGSEINRVRNREQVQGQEGQVAPSPSLTPEEIAIAARKERLSQAAAQTPKAIAEGVTARTAKERLAQLEEAKKTKPTKAAQTIAQTAMLNQMKRNGGVFEVKDTDVPTAQRIVDQGLAKWGRGESGIRTIQQLEEARKAPTPTPVAEAAPPAEVGVTNVSPSGRARSRLGGKAPEGVTSEGQAALDRAQRLAEKAASKRQPEESAAAKLERDKKQSQTVLRRLENAAVAKGWSLEGTIKPRVSRADVEKALKGTDLDIHALKTGLLDIELQDMGDGTFAIHRRGIETERAQRLAEKAASKVMPESVGARKGTAEGQARVEAARQRLRDVINNPDITGKERATAIANHKQLIGFLKAHADTRKPLETDYFKGDQIAYTGVTTSEGYREFIYLEGHKAGDYGVTPVKEAKVTPVAPVAPEAVREGGQGTTTETRTPKQIAADEAQAKLDALGPEPRKPSPEKRFFGATGREGASPEVVARYDAEAKAYASWRRKYNKLKTAQVEASNAAFRERQLAEASKPTAPEPTGSLLSPTSVAAAKSRIAARKAKGGEGFLKGEKGELDVNALSDLLIVGADHVRQGAKDFADWSKRVADDLGEWVRPYLTQDAYDHAKEMYAATVKAPVPAVTPSATTTTISGKAPQVEARPVETPTPTEAATVATSGIAHRVEAARREAIGQPEPIRGEGISSQAAVQYGRDAIANGTDPQAVADKFHETGEFSFKALSVLRAHKADLERIANEAFDKYGEQSLEYKAAEQAVTDWYDKNVKPMQTEWHRTGQTQQGETEIDTGSYLGLKRAFTEMTGKEDFTPQEAAKAKIVAKRVQKAQTEAADANAKLLDEVKKAYPEPKPKPLPKTTPVAKYGESNKIFTADRMNAAMELLKERGRIERRSGGPSTEELKALGDIAGYHIEAGARTFAQFSKRMVDQVGDWVKPYLPDLFKDAKSAALTENLRTQFADKTDAKFSKDQLGGIWQKVREYVDKGVTDYADIRAGVAADLGLSVEQVTRALNENRQIRRLSDEAYMRMSTLRQVKNNAQMWVRSAGNPAYWNALSRLPGLFFSAKVFGHGTVGMITHAGKNIFLPETWSTYWPQFFNQFKLAYKKGFHEQAMQDLERRPNWVTARRAGLANDPMRYYDDYQNPLMAKFFGKVGLAGNHGFDSLKLFRQDLFDHYWDPMPDAMKTPETAKWLANRVNHATGAINARTPKLMNAAFFAPALEGSRWAWAIGDPVKAIKTFSKWGDATPGEKYMAKMILRQSAEFVATTAGLLAVNQGLLKATGSQDRVNMTDPTKPDWLRFKAPGGLAIDATGGMVSLLSFLTKIGMASARGMGVLPKRGPDTPADQMKLAFGQYLRGKLHPFTGTLADLITTTDYMGKPLPHSIVKPKPGTEKYTWGQYLLEQQTPIPVGEAFKAVDETMKSRGMTKPQVRDYIEGAAIGLGSGATGARVMHITPNQAAEEKQAAVEMRKAMIEGLRKNPNDYSKIDAALEKGLITPQQEKEMTKEANLSETQATFKHLPLESKLQVYRAYTPKEKEETRDLLLEAWDNANGMPRRSSKTGKYGKPSAPTVPEATLERLRKQYAPEINQ